MERKFKFITLFMILALIAIPNVWGQVANIEQTSWSRFAASSLVANRDVTSGAFVNPEGRGDALIFPYYDVRKIDDKSQATLIAIINESATGVGTVPDDSGANVGIIARVGFREWDKSIEVLDFHIYLSDEDVWVGVITLNEATGLAKITSPDYIVVDADSSYFYLDKAFATLGCDFIIDRINYTPPTGITKEMLTHMGYIEVIGEESTDRKPTLASGTGPYTGQPYTARVARNVEGDCPNNLMGQAVIVRVDDGVAMGYNATAIGNFARNIGTLFQGIGLDVPTLASAEDTLNQIEFILSKEDIFAAYAIDPEIGARASLIVTFPTKHFHYLDFGKRDRIASSDNAFQAPYENDGEEIGVTIWDRNENQFTLKKGFVSPQPTKKPVALPYEVNVIGFYPGTTATATGRDNIAFPVGDFVNGWVWLSLNPSESPKSAEPVLIDYYQLFGHLFSKYYGLPVLALQLQEATNLTVGAGAYYGEINEAWYEIDWVETIGIPLF